MNQELLRLSKRVKALQAKLGEGLFEMGRLLARIQEQDLYAAEGFVSLVAFAQAKLELSAASVYRSLGVYRNFGAKIAGEYGVSKLEAGLAYLRATPVQERPGDLIASSIRLRSKSGTFVKKRFHDATVRQIREATQLMRETHRPGRLVPVRVRKQITTLAKQLPHAPSRFTRGHRVRMHRDAKSGRLFASVAALPLDSLDEVIAFFENIRRTVKVTVRPSSA